MSDENQIDSFDDLFEPFELEEGPPPSGSEPAPPPPPPVREDEPQPSVSCPSCGTANPAFNRHCEACGARLGKGPLPVAPPPGIRTTPGARALGVLAAVVLIVALVAALLTIFGGDDEGATTQTTLPPTTTVAAQIEELRPTSVEASSQLGASFDASNLIDGNADTEWQDNGLRGEGATLTFRFGQAVSITEIEIYNLADDARFKQNYRVRGFKITVDDLGYQITGQLNDVNTPQRIALGTIKTRTLTLEVTSTFDAQAVDGGVPFEELALADVRFFGRLAE